jgi:hypothetical protein
VIFKTGERQLVVFLPRKTAHVLHTRSAPLLGFVGLLGAKRLIGRYPSGVSPSSKLARVLNNLPGCNFQLCSGMCRKGFPLQA